MATYTATRIVIATTSANKLGNLIYDALVHDTSVEIVKAERGVLELRAWTGPREDDSNTAAADPAADY
jgi:hypothetical protein